MDETTYEADPDTFWYNGRFPSLFFPIQTETVLVEPRQRLYQRSKLLTTHNTYQKFHQGWVNLRNEHETRTSCQLVQVPKQIQFINDEQKPGKEQVLTYDNHRL